VCLLIETIILRLPLSASGAVVGVGIGTGLGEGLVTKTRACFIYVRAPAIQRIGMESWIIYTFSSYRTSLHYAELHLSADARELSADRTRDYTFWGICHGAGTSMSVGAGATAEDPDSWEWVRLNLRIYMFKRLYANDHSVALSGH
jgi:phosphate/sulfate permease